MPTKEYNDTFAVSQTKRLDPAFTARIARKLCNMPSWQLRALDISKKKKTMALDYLFCKMY